MPVLAVENLKVCFFTRHGAVPAVDGVSFSVEAGEVLGLVGESGSGKSMTGYSLMGLVDPPGRIVDGRIVLDGMDLRALPGEALRKLRGNRIAMIFQDPMMTLNPVLRVDTQMIETMQAHAKVSRADALGHRQCTANRRQVYVQPRAAGRRRLDHRQLLWPEGGRNSPRM